MKNSSLPSRERGLKSNTDDSGTEDGTVAPFAGAWIEIVVLSSKNCSAFVAPFAGAWIEMFVGGVYDK